MSRCGAFIGLTNRCWLEHPQSLDLTLNPWWEWFFCLQWIPQHGWWDCVSWWNTACPDSNLHIHLLWLAAAEAADVFSSCLILLLSVASTRVEVLYAWSGWCCYICLDQGTGERCATCVCHIIGHFLIYYIYFLISYFLHTYKPIFTKIPPIVCFVVPMWRLVSHLFFDMVKKNKNVCRPVGVCEKIKIKWQAFRIEWGEKLCDMMLLSHIYLRS